ncbi:MAG: hypothetical protein JXX28_07900 [Deltaproteobacteria bacterium]|nr:hypothetical protein [Deltaproteobacteria bacterium]
MPPSRVQPEEQFVGPLGWVGCGCGCFSGLLIFGAIMAVTGLLMGAHEWGLTWPVSGGLSCVGIVGVIIGIVLYIKGQN